MVTESRGGGGPPENLQGAAPSGRGYEQRNFHGKGPAVASFSARGLNREGEDVPGLKGQLEGGDGTGGSGLGSLGHQCRDTGTGRLRPGRGAHGRVLFPESSWEWTRASGGSVLEPCKHFSP